MSRAHSFIDLAVGTLDQGLRLLFGPEPRAERPAPGSETTEDVLDPVARDTTVRLMRVNHAGEVCAQALYQGQALTARAPAIRDKLERAAREENDHLAWTAARVQALGGRTSYLDPLWYTGSLAIGAVAGLAGDRWSLGFLAETERQVVEHLEGHLRRLPPEDQRSRAIVEQMRDDEGGHATTAIEAGARDLPRPVKALMRVSARVMTTTAYWL